MMLDVSKGCWTFDIFVRLHKAHVQHLCVSTPHHATLIELMTIIMHMLLFVAVYILQTIFYFFLTAFWHESLLFKKKPVAELFILFLA